MWGKIKADKIVAIYKSPVNLVDAQGTVYPKSYFKDNTKLAEFSVYPVIFVNGRPAKQFLYNYGGESFAWNSVTSVIDGTYSDIAKNINDVNVVWTKAEIDDGFAPSGTKANDAKLDKDGNQLVTIGLKTELTAKVKYKQSSLLSQTDKWVTRKSEKGTAIPTKVTTYRDGIRSAATTMITSIDDASDFDAIFVLFNVTYNDAGVMTAPAPLYNFPNEPDGMPQ